MSTPPSDGISAATSTKPWSEFFSTSAISLPVSFSDITTRITHNLSYFKVNYFHIFLTIFFISLFFHPLSLFILFLTALVWYFFFFNRRDEEPFEVYGFTISDQVIGGVLGVITLIALIYASVWVELLVSIAISAGLIGLHAIIRVSSFGDDNPYGGLLDAESGGYRQF